MSTNSGFGDGNTLPLGRSSGTSTVHRGELDRERNVSVRDLRKSFGDATVMNGLTLEFEDNAVTTVLGPSGTGKSVLLKHIVGLLEPDSGRVDVFGKNIWSMNENARAEMRKRFGVLFQDGALFGSMNVFDNVAFPLRKHTEMMEEDVRDVVWNSLREVGLEAAANREPGALSGGMRKRAGFARALVMQPEVVMFDEPDSGLDPVRTSLLNDLILQVHEQHQGTYILVTHDIETARKVSDYVALVWQGTVIHYGPTAEAFESDDPFVQQFLTGSSAGPLGMD
ncbi:phospholipid/cholesterol/gamma-HCH transport system ATP-binding protein [Haloechinothrix alba]|uniref:Phospholipid/cholesterol/gamma-HCH transport system ATP-binding protein n=1 Tax=Haloechinothrix alba TaxID=664784 RepID=A0A238XN56_9PSEU|nr:ABC transporter ATP-binding protein [Haloechinothrix alba]SNR60456.1 phospholipid/cholesterol/gamma-HCH transport system ATP-binding protein [Haloechinothrix alba]